MSQVNLANSLVAAGDMAAARAAFEAALAAAPDDAPAHRGLARLAADRGDHALAAQHLNAAFAGRPVIEQLYRGDGPPITLLLLISGLAADIPLSHALDPAVFKVIALAPAFFDPAQPLPAHDLAFNTIGDADLAPEALRAAERLIDRLDRPLINPPERVAVTGRVENARRLAGLPGVVTAASVLLPRDEAAALDRAAVQALGLDLPLAVRAPGYHTGLHFERIDQIDQLAAAVASLPGERVILMRFIDTQGADGLYRKYRAMIVDGALYPLHLAVSAQWKAHYFTADMAGSPARRAEDLAYLQDMGAVIGPVAMAGLEAVRQALGLDYGGIDFALGPDGALVVFEANATMVVYPPPADPIWDYRRAPTQRILEALKTMLIRRARAGA